MSDTFFGVISYVLQSIDIISNTLQRYYTLFDDKNTLSFRFGLILNNMKACHFYKLKHLSKALKEILVNKYSIVCGVVSKITLVSNILRIIFDELNVEMNRSKVCGKPMIFGAFHINDIGNNRINTKCDILQIECGDIQKQSSIDMYLRLLTEYDLTSFVAKDENGKDCFVKVRTHLQKLYVIDCIGLISEFPLSQTFLCAQKMTVKLLIYSKKTIRNAIIELKDTKTDHISSKEKKDNIDDDEQTMDLTNISFSTVNHSLSTPNTSQTTLNQSHTPPNNVHFRPQSMSMPPPLQPMPPRQAISSLDKFIFPNPNSQDKTVKINRKRRHSQMVQSNTNNTNNIQQKKKQKIRKKNISNRTYSLRSRGDMYDKKVNGFEKLLKKRNGTVEEKLNYLRDMSWDALYDFVAHFKLQKYFGNKLKARNIGNMKSVLSNHKIL